MHYYMPIDKGNHSLTMERLTYTKKKVKDQVKEVARRIRLFLPDSDNENTDRVELVAKKEAELYWDL